jgi:hypothetical protein
VLHPGDPDQFALIGTTQQRPVHRDDLSIAVRPWPAAAARAYK